jgi:hypothetical protein
MRSLSVVQHEKRLDDFFTALSADLAADTDVSCERLKARMRKRARYSSSSADQKAIDSFLSVNSQLVGFAHRLPAAILSNARDFIERALWRVAADYGGVQDTLDMDILFDMWRFGPGSSVGTKATHTAEKIYDPMCCTLLARPLVSMLRERNPYFRMYDSLADNGTPVVSGSKLTTVPKNKDISRTIASEPLGNMALQLAAGSYLTEALRHIGLDLEKQQPINRGLAWRGSVDGTLATMDLSQASDRISPSLVRALLPPIWFELLWRLRSPSTTIKGVRVDLAMMSTMGNGFTFPLMTLILLALLWANTTVKGMYIDYRKYAVFGDDIILPAEEYDSFTTVLEAAGFVINHDKSYPAGPFRESCGGDYYEGQNVTPFYVKSLSSNPEVYIALNQVLSWSARHEVWPFQSIEILKSFVDGPVYLVPEWSNDDSGVRSSQVPRKYNILRPRSISRTLSSEFFKLPLAAGGYLFSDGDETLFTPRPRGQVNYRSHRARLPRGFLDGSDPLLWSAAVRSRADLMIAISLAS